MNQMPGPWDGLEVEPAHVPALTAGAAAFFAVCLPPPVHGQSLVNASVIEAAKAFAGAERIEVFDIGPGANKFGLKYHLTRIMRVLRAGAALARGGVRPGQSFYTVFESGFGVIYNFFLIALARLLGRQIVLHHHTSQHTLERQPRFALLQRVAGRDCVNVVLSEEMAENLHLLYPRLGRVLVSHNACHIAAPVDQAPRPARKGLRIGYLSNLCREKGLDVVLDAAGKCRARGLDVTFVVAGPASGADAEALLAEARARLGERLEIIGSVKGASKEDFFKSIDLFLFPTRYRYEAQPLVLLEAMSYGIPAVTTDCGYIAELVGRHGVVLDPTFELAEEIAQRLEQIVADPRVMPRAGEVRAKFRRMRATALWELRELVTLLFVAQPKETHGAPPFAQSDVLHALDA